jgi:hypothetical protein
MSGLPYDSARQPQEDSRTTRLPQYPQAENTLRIPGRPTSAVPIAYTSSLKLPPSNCYGSGLLCFPSTALKEDATLERIFHHAYPEYASTLPLDLLRDENFSRLSPANVYVDAMGGALYPESLVCVHSDFLKSTILGNTHSESAWYVLLSRPTLGCTDARY